MRTFLRAELIIAAFVLTAAAQDSIHPVPHSPRADSLQGAAARHDTTAAPSIDTSDTVESEDTADVQENEFQESIDSLFAPHEVEVDTFAWSNSRINSGYIDYTTRTDTVRIALVDSAHGMCFVPPCGTVITSDFGLRKWMWHYGVDIRLSRGDTVRSVFDGIVRVRQFDRHGYGNAVVVRHPRGLETVYGHLSKVLVEANQRVRAGDVLGLGGSTGHSTGPHLHLETRYYGEPFDPNLVVDVAEQRLKSDTLVLTQADFEYLIEQRKAQWMVVRRGDFLGRIARRYGTTVTKLCQLNHISGKTLLRVGRKLRYR